MTAQSIATEIEALHKFFVEWFGGRSEHSMAQFENSMSQRLAEGFVLIQPTGKRFNRRGIIAAIASGRGSNPEFRIAIRDLIVCESTNDWVLVTYEEWQRDALGLTPKDNGRISTALFRKDVHAPGGLRWQHVHETWLPTEIMAEGPYDF